MAAVCALGGIAGYVSKRSMPSLLGGLGIGAAYLLSAHLIKEVDEKMGHGAGFFTSLSLTAIMGARALKTKKLMPAGLMTGLGSIAMVYHSLKFSEWNQ
jgi:uncharacterized membrane protein (UPF0136 family)